MRLDWTDDNSWPLRASWPGLHSRAVSVETTTMVTDQATAVVMDPVMDQVTEVAMEAVMDQATAVVTDPAMEAVTATGQAYRKAAH
jgi:hypothetical protein